ncbi:MULTISPECIES: CDP-6-deoxy-delta-3,4-glucoseen reductase [Methylobacillus]|uniref:Oxidoreductase FAD/NAD(P)-binding protein n=1 Tax=Methylobacillus flagellatus (strain ATCC 51484 / DSM 6875 / VKM B-1610 / KT) TaxID=265072 RepID=Q1GX94_METFK|nr:MULTISPECIES: CDP-6-deoxy-delta-3,4-glucoseen reductase [Methylobacillus]ABE48302.1 oxidoreductase FAD/NAD(P)-binding protein [Methylobacillus flagellatus KT]MPS47403.1 CDP-6-deoxy-delta-3,4-glucoseen reductase [Methylobacillus sp.]
MSFQVIIKPSDRTFIVEDDDTVLDAAIEAGINLPYGCRNGTCGACKGQLLAGDVEYGEYFDSALSELEKKTGKALFCCARPLADLVIECREVVGEGIPPRIMPVRVEKLEKLSHDVMGMTLKLPSHERMQFMAGQYIEFLLNDGRRRAFSLASAPHQDRFLELHMRLVPGGQFTQYVFNEMQEKTILRIEGPFGTFFLREDSLRPVILVAGGTGFAPVKGIVEHALQQGMKRPMTLYWGARTRADLYLDALPRRWQEEHPWFRYIPVLSDPVPEDAWQGRTGLVHQAVLEDHPDMQAYQVYCCGAPQMVEVAHRDFQAHGLPEQEFFSDAFTFANPGAKAAI